MSKYNLCIYYIVFGFLFFFTSNSHVQQISEKKIFSDKIDNSPSFKLWNANWVATDGAGRKIIEPYAAGPIRLNKYVGIFYFAWHGAYRGKIYDNTKILTENSQKPKYGPVGSFHWWGEPEAGYYKADDPWVIQRNIYMLINAGIDILFIDVTNKDIYISTIKKLCKALLTARQKGYNAPYICFVTNTESKTTINNLYNQFYSQDEFKPVWFKWHGKPLILGDHSKIENEVIRNFFTWRYSWQFTDAKSQPGHWQWLDNTPQNYGWISSPNQPEEIPVAVASHPVFGVGKSYYGGKEPILNKYKVSSKAKYGYHFREQWERAMTIDPPVVFVTGWNEWLAIRFVADTNDHSQVFKSFVDHKLLHGETFFQDEFNQEFNRDIEPMLNGYSDNYYYQLVNYVRRFKGLENNKRKMNVNTISIDGTFKDWVNASSTYYDFEGDVLHRNWRQYDNMKTLTNKTGRNDIIESRATHDEQSVYFYVKTKNKISPISKNWMLLFINIDNSKKTGWEGYDYVINKTVHSNSKTSIHKWRGGKYNYLANISYAVKNNEMEIRVDKKTFVSSSTKLLNFHWADNIQQWNDIKQFFINGDSAPDRRFDYRFELE